MFMFFLTKIIKACDDLACDAYLKQDTVRKEFLDEFVLAAKLISRGKFDKALTHLTETRNKMTDEDELMPIKLSKDMEIIKNLMTIYDSKNSKASTFDGETILKLVEYIKESLAQPIDQGNKIPEEKIAPANKSEDNKSTPHISDDFGIGKKLLTPKEPQAIKKEIQKILQRVGSNLAKYINSERDELSSFRNQLYNIQFKTRSYSDFEIAVKNFKQQLDTVLNPNSPDVSDFNRLYSLLQNQPTNSKELEYQAELSLKGDSDDFLISLIYKGISHTYRLTSEERKEKKLPVDSKVLVVDKNTYNLGGKNTNFLELIFLYLKAYYYYEVKDIAYDKLTNAGLSFAEKISLMNYFFGTSSDSFDPENTFTNFKGSASNYKLLNQYAGRRLLKRKKIANFISTSQINKIKNLHELFDSVDISKIEKPNKKLRILLAVALGISLLASGLFLKNCFTGGSSGGGSGDDIEDSDIDNKDKAPNIIKVPPDFEKGKIEKDEKKPPIKSPYKRNKKRVPGKGDGNGNGDGTGDGDGNGKEDKLPNPGL